MPFPVPNELLQAALAERGYLEPTAVQSAILEPETIGRDLLVSARTGSGKTVAFGLAMAPTLLDGQDRFGPPGAPIALAIAPTRELALQVRQELEWLYAKTGARIASCVGGMDMRREQRALASGVHIVVGTPGRLRDHIDRGNLDTTAMKVVVLDEADEMLDLGFQEELEAILESTPDDRRTLLFSATLPREIVGLAKRYQNDPIRIAATAEDEPHGDIEYRAVVIRPHEAEHAVVNILRYFESPGALVFCATREAVRKLHGNLLERGFTAVALSGELSQAERSHALQALRDGHARVCVATDVAARGIDLPDLGLVIQADAPRTAQVLLHRSGRTGRAGRKGVCVLLVPQGRRRSAERMFGTANVQPEWSGPPSAEVIRDRDRERLLSQIGEAAEPVEEDKAAIEALMAGSTPEQLALALVRLWRERLPAPEEIAEDAPEPRRERAERQEGRERPERPARARPEIGDGGHWFRMNVGRAANADPRWMIPIICRRGGITKNQIGAIRIDQRETLFEVAPDAADAFTANLRKPDRQDPQIRIQPLAHRADRMEPVRRPESSEASTMSGRHRPARKPFPAGPRKTGERRKPETGAGESPPRRKR